MKPFKCPVCDGCGKVLYNFYKDKSDTGLNEECRTCKGLGILWEGNEETNTFKYYPPMQNDSDNNRYDPCKNCPVRLNPNWNGICHCALPYIVNPLIYW